MKITVEEALIKTAIVEIKTLTVSGRQVTLAVFRQLQKEDVVDYESLQLNGVIWGKVNYHPADCIYEKTDHVHLIWQSGAELRRSCVAVNNADHVNKNYREAITNAKYEFLAAAACEDGFYFINHICFGWTSFNYKSIQSNVYVDHERPLAKLLDANWHIGKGKGDETDVCDSKTYKQLAQEYIELVRRDFPLSEEKAIEKIRVLEKEYEMYVKNWQGLYQKLKSMQQLFIAI